MDTERESQYVSASPHFNFTVSASLARMMGGAAVPAAATTVTLMTAGAVTTPPTLAGEETEGPMEASPGDAAAVEMISWTWRGIAVTAAAPGAGETITMTASCERPWSERRWANSRGHAAGSVWTARATAQTEGGRHRFPRTRPLGTPVAVMTFHHRLLRRTVRMKVSHLQRKVTFAR